MAENKFEEDVDCFVRASRDGGLDLFDDALAMIPGPEEIPLDGSFPEGKAEGRDDEPQDVFEADGPDKNQDPVRLYLREMGLIPLLNRSGEISIARRIERGRTRTRTLLSRCPIILQEFVRLAADVHNGSLAAREILLFTDPIPTDETYAAGAKEMINATQ